MLDWYEFSSRLVIVEPQWSAQSSSLFVWMSLDIWAQSVSKVIKEVDVSRRNQLFLKALTFTSTRWSIFECTQSMIKWYRNASNRYDYDNFDGRPVDCKHFMICNNPFYQRINYWPLNPLKIVTLAGASGFLFALGYVVILEESLNVNV